MAIAYLGALAASSSKTAGTQILITLTAGCAAGSKVFVLVGADPGFLNSGRTDTRGNTWNQVTPAGGTNNSVYCIYSDITTALQTGDVITLTFNGSITAKAWVVLAFSGVKAGANTGSAQTFGGSTAITTLSLGFDKTSDPNGMALMAGVFEGPTADNLVPMNLTGSTEASTTGGSATSNQSLVAGYKLGPSNGVQYGVENQTVGRIASLMTTYWEAGVVVPVLTQTSLIDAVPAVYAPALRYTQPLTASLIDAAGALYSPTAVKFSATQSLTATLITSVSSLYGPELQAGPVAASVGFIDAAAAVYDPLFEVIIPTLSMDVPLLESFPPFSTEAGPWLKPGMISYGATGTRLWLADYIYMEGKWKGDYAFNYGEPVPKISGVPAWFNYNRCLSRMWASGSTSEGLFTPNGPTAGLEFNAYGTPDFWSEAVNADVTISGPISFWAWAQCGSAGPANIAINFLLYVMDGITGALTLVHRTNNTESVAISPAPYGWAETPTPFTMHAGDRLRVVVFGDDASSGPMLYTGDTVQFYYGQRTPDTSGWTYIRFAETLPMAPISELPWGDVSGKCYYVDVDSGTKLYLTHTDNASLGAGGRGLDFVRGSGAVVAGPAASVAGPTVPIQYKDSLGNPLSFWTPRLAAMTLSRPVTVMLSGYYSGANPKASWRAVLSVHTSTGSLVGEVGFAGASYQEISSERSQYTLFMGKPVVVPEGGRIRLRVYFDDSAENMAAGGNLYLKYGYTAAEVTAGGGYDAWLQFWDTVAPYLSVENDIQWRLPNDGVVIAPNEVMQFWSPAATQPMHFQMQVDEDPAFGSPMTFDSYSDPTGWEYNGSSSWLPFTAAGMPAEFAYNGVRYTPQTPWPVGVIYRRVRAGYHQ